MIEPAMGWFIEMAILCSVLLAYAIYMHGKIGRDG